MSDPVSENLLAGETSPYLLQHKDNPVHWRAWNRASLDLAKREDKPILLSIGYAACHWCHVMAHESFEDDAIAGLMNDHFVNIKVDREERPDLDAVYQAALQMLGEHGGWPLTMFLTPDGEPFWGGTYFPPAARWGRPGFPDVLRSLAETYRTNPDAVTKNVGALRDGLSQLATSKAGEGLTPAGIEQAARATLRLVDPYRGGTHGAPKFPQPMTFRFLWQAWLDSRAPMLREAVVVTLDNLCQGGIYDHLGGGFARYATDDAWLVPHFEKMLYDNALLLELLADAWRGTGRALYATRAAETVDWLLRDMRVDAEGDGFAFASAFDADSEGEEGKYYVWTKAEIDDLLGADAPAFCDAYDVRPGGNWEGNTILNRSHSLTTEQEADEARLAANRATLLTVRDKRVPPMRDDKVLADWNGLAIAALAGAGRTFGRPDWVDAAATAFAFVVTHMSDGERLRHSWRAGTAGTPGVLDDYANMARAALALYEATGEADYLDRARGWAAAAATHHGDPAGGYILSAADANDVIARTKTAFDNAVPSGNGTMAEVLARLYMVTGETKYREQAERTIAAFTGEAPEHLVAMPVLVMAARLLHAGTQIVVAGDADDAATQALLRAADTAPVSGAVITRVAPGAALPDGHPAAGKGPVDGRPAAYVCRGPVCGPPATEPEELTRLLSED